MKILHRKKIFIYVIGIAAVVIVCLLEPFILIGKEQYSVLGSIVRLSREERQHYTVIDAIRHGISGWAYILVPIIASIPQASCVNDKITSRFCLFAESRQGRMQYAFTDLLWNLISSSITSLIGFGIYALICDTFFPTNPDMSQIQIIGYEEISFTSQFLYITNKFLYMTLYCIAISLVTSFLVMIYQNLYFDLSVIFILNYMLRRLFMRDLIYIPLIIIGITALMYGPIEKLRSRRL